MTDAYCIPISCKGFFGVELLKMGDNLTKSVPPQCVDFLQSLSPRPQPSSEDSSCLTRLSLFAFVLRLVALSDETGDI